MIWQNSVICKKNHSTYIQSPVYKTAWCRNYFVCPRIKRYYESTTSKYSINNGGSDPRSTFNANRMLACSWLRERSKVSFIISLARCIPVLDLRHLRYDMRVFKYWVWRSSINVTSVRPTRSATKKKKKHTTDTI